MFIKRESSKIIHNFNDIITNWFKKRDQLIFIIESEVTDKGIPTLLESRLLNKIRNLEVFYRNFFREEQEDLQEYNDIKTEILTFIDKNIKNNEYKDSFKDKVNYKGEVSLRYKLVTLFKRLPQELAEIILKMEGKSLSGSRNKMAFSLKETRNYWTHGDTLDDYPKRLKGYDEIYPIYKKLIIIEKYFVLLELGVSEDLIINYLLTLYQKYANF